MKKEDLRNHIKGMIKDFENMDYKENAWKEFDEIRKTYPLDNLKNICFIIDNYPDFNHIEVKITQPKAFVMKICLDIDYLKKLNEKELNKVIDNIYENFAKYSRMENEI